MSAASEAPLVCFLRAGAVRCVAGELELDVDVAVFADPTVSWCGQRLRYVGATPGE